MKHLTTTVIITLSFFTIFGQNYVPILPTDSERDIITKAAHVTPSPRQLRWQELEMTAFFHFGINTFTDREWGQGHEDKKLFNPTQLDADQWVKVCKEAGIKLAILTAKHHDGFCLWPSKYTEHSVKNSPWKGGKGDIVSEVANACRKQKMGFGVYLSPWDITEASYGTDAYNDFFVNQLTELLTNYGKVDEVWFDGACGEGPNGKKQVYDFERYYALIRKLQPEATIAIMGPDVRWVGTESGYGRETEWSVMPVDSIIQESIAKNSQTDATFAPIGDMTESDLASRPKIMNAKGLIWYPSEIDVSIRPGWFYHKAEDTRVKTPEKLYDIYFSSVGRNGVLLLNIPPDKKGLIHKNDVKSLKKWKKLLDRTFSENMAKGAIAHCANGKNVEALFDQKNDTHFTTAHADTTTSIEIQLDGQKTFDVLLLQENIRVGQRVEAFTLEAWHQNQWKHIVSGTTIGYKRLLRFEPITASKVRLNILSSRLNPTISEMGLYKMPNSKLYIPDKIKTLRTGENKHLASGKSSILTTPPDPKYNKAGNAAWNNGIFGSSTAFNDGEWLGWNGADFEGTIDLVESQNISYVSLDVMNNPQSWIFMPSEVSIYTSDDNINYKKVGTKSKFSLAHEGVFRIEFAPNSKARYLRILAKHFGNIPSGYAGAGSPAWLFVDEVIVK